MVNLDVTTPDAFSVRAAPVNPVSVSPGGEVVILVPTPGVPGPPGSGGGGGASTVDRVTAYALSGHRLVTPRNDGTVEYADCMTIGHISRPVWLTTGAWSSGVTATLVVEDIVTEPTWNWVPGQSIWLGLNGVLTQTIPVGALFIRRVAEVIDATTIEFSVGDAIAVS